MRAQRLSALAVGALAALGAVPYGVVSAHAAPATDPTTELVVDAANNNQLMHGASGSWSTAGHVFSVGGGTTTVTFTVSGLPNNLGSFRGTLTAPSGQQLTVGKTYSGGDSPAPSISFGTDGGACGTASSSFTVDELTMANNAITNAEIEFWSNCGAPMHGLLRYNATAAVPAGAPTGVPITGVAGVPTGTVGPISFKRGGAIVVDSGTGVDGTAVGQMSALDDGAVKQTWNPLGTRLFYVGDKGLVSVRPDGSASTAIAGFPSGGAPGEVSISPDGSTAVFADGYVYALPTDGSASADVSLANDYRILVPPPNGGPSGSTPYLHPHFLPDGSLLLTGTDNAYQNPSLYRYANGAVHQVVANADFGTPSADGKRIAFIRPDSAGVKQLFVVGADGSSGLTQLTHGSDDVTEPSWSPDGKYLAYEDAAFREVIEVAAAGGTVVGSIPNATSPVWTPPIIDSHIVREAGADRLGTAIAASQLNFADHGVADGRRVQAGAVVLARSDTFADALGGSALAVRKNAPLLITGSAALNPAVKSEIGRVLAPGGTVYLLGGTQALSPAVASALSHYHVVRLAGQTRYGTAVAIAEQISARPSTVMIATGALFPDALAAGATGEPVLLTDGATMPKETAAYLNALNPNPSAAGGTELVTIGGPGDAALRSAYQAGKMPRWPSQISRLKLAGSDRYATALMVAKAFFTSNTDVALATGASWPDALSGGAMIGYRGGPLLLTDPTGLSPAALSYLSSQSASLYDLFLMGGTAALPDAIGQQAARVIGLPGHVRIGGAFAAAGGSGEAPTGAGVDAAGAAKGGTAGRTPHGDELSPLSREG